MNLTILSVVLNLIYADAIEEITRRDAVLPNLLQTEFEANSTCAWNVKIAARTTAGAKAEGYAVQSSDYESDTRVQASLAWAHYEAYAKVTGTAQRISAANGRLAGGGDGAIMEELSDAVNELAVKISQHTYSGSVAASPAQIEGLARAVDSTGTYAGISQGTYADWASGENTHALASISVDAIRTKLLRPFKDNTGRYPRFAICPGNVFDAVAGLFDASTTIQTTTVQTAQMGTVDIGKMGFRGIMVDGVPIIEDRHCTANTMYALDDEKLSYRQVPPVWTSYDPGQLQALVKQVTGKTIPLNEIEAALQRASRRLAVQINALAKDGDSTKLQVVLDCQLRLKARNAAAKLTFT